MKNYILAIDQGTTSSRAIIFDQTGKRINQQQLPIKQSYPHNGWVEHDPEEIWQTTLNCCRQVLEKAQLKSQELATIGISNQRETTVLWDRNSGKAIYPAIVWQDRRTADYCNKLKEHESWVNAKTGLLLDPYFSASKIKWILDNVPIANKLAAKNQLAFGTIDSYLLWHLTQGKVHATDVSNASRSLLFNIHKQCWDDELIKFFDIPKTILPEVKSSNAHFGETDPKLLATAIPITGILGDQQAASFGQACFQPGMAKSTFGTGSFVLLNTGEQIMQSHNKLLSTIAYGINNKVTYGLEGSIFNAGTVIQWLRDNLHILNHAQESEQLAKQVTNNGGVYFIPAFTGLGAPYWQPDARAAILGLTRDSSSAHIVRAALESIAYQSKDLLDAMEKDYGQKIKLLRVDGGMSANNWLMQFLADIVTMPIERPQCIETSALGAALMAGLGAGIYKSLDELSKLWELDQHFDPLMAAATRDDIYQQWQKNIKSIL